MIKEIKEIIKEQVWEMDWGDETDLVNLCYELENRGQINFCVEKRSTDSDSWLQAEYYSEKLCKTIIWDYGYQDSFEGIDDFAEEIMRTASEICEFEKKIHI